MKKLLSSILALSILLLMPIKTYAHSVTDCGYSHSGSYNGWDIFESSIHSASYNQDITVNCGAFTANDFKPYIDNAITTWNNTTFQNTKLVKMSASSSGSVIFRSKTNQQIITALGSSSWAFVYRSNAIYDQTALKSGLYHYSTAANSVEIWVNWNDVVSNKSTTSKTHVALHELGHVIGLQDIPSSVSYNSYLMCNEFGTNTPPTTITNNDKQGASVILGQHTSHSFTLYQSYNSTKHHKICSICGVYSLETHTFTSNKCTKCGYIN